MNSFTTPREIAQALNFGKYPVLTFNSDTRQGSKARIRKQTARYGETLVNCELERSMIQDGEGYVYTFYLSANPSVIKGQYGWKDYLEDAEFANAPIIDANQEVAILIYSEKSDAAFVKLVYADHISSDYATTAKFQDVE